MQELTAGWQVSSPRRCNEDGVLLVELETLTEWWTIAAAEHGSW